MKKFRCVCNKEFKSFKEYVNHAKNCEMYQRKQDRDARLKIENELNLSG